MTEISSEVLIKKPKRLTSVVWNHFERVKKDDICYAVCVHCSKKLSGSSNSGTTHLRNHLMRCLKRSNFDVSQLLSVKRRKKDSTVTIAKTISEENVSVAAVQFDKEHRRNDKNALGNASLDQERSRVDLARMIILHGYPLTMVDQVGFKVFVKNLQPFFEFEGDNEIEGICMELYTKEKNKVFEMIKKLQSGINLSVDVWTSCENSGYLSLTAHYIDEDWKLQKKILNFISLESSYTEDILSEIIIRCLVEWNLDRKLFSMTFNDIFAIDNNTLKIKDWLSQSRPLLGKGHFFDISCVVIFLKLIIQDAMEAIQDVTQKIRDSFRHVKSSRETQKKFNDVSQQVQIKNQTSLILDSPLHYDSSYRMIKTALDYRGTFSLLQEHDITYKTVLSETEWDQVNYISCYLKLIFDVITAISTTNHPTANIYFPEIGDLHVQLTQWCKNPDQIISSMAVKMKSKFDQYWSKCSLSLAIAAILDPRFKMKLVEYYYSQIYGTSSLNRIKDVSDELRVLFNAYSIGPTSSSPSTTIDHDRLRGFDEFLHETTKNERVVSELDKYLSEPVFPRDFGFNILNWWKVHKARYPTLSMMAHDVLGIPMVTVAPELAFNNEGRVLDHSRSLLNPDTREALICTQDWLREEFEESKPSSSRSMQI